MSGSEHHGNEQVMDLAVLQDIIDLMEEDFPDLIRTFLADTNALLDEIALGLSQGDSALVNRAAHKLKASASSLGAAGLSEQARALEAFGRADDLTEADAALVAARDQFGLVAEILEQTISGLT